MSYLKKTKAMPVQNLFRYISFEIEKQVSEQAEICIQTAPNNSNESYTFTALKFKYEI